MQEKQVPQDHNSLLNGERKAVYAVGEDGKYKIVPSIGWNVEEQVTTLHIEEFRRLATEALARACKKECSSLEFHMYNRRMDPTLLAQCTGFFKWTVLRHLKPQHFEKCPEHKKQCYAEALGLSLAELDTLPEFPA